MNILSIISHFCLGFITSFIGSIPIGSINATVVRISITQKLPAALKFIIGATIAELFYSFICVHFSGFLLSIPKLEFYIQVICVPVFIIIGFSYWYAKPKTVQKTSEHLSTGNHFFQGLSIGFLNPLQIPFWLAYTTYFLSVGWIKQSAFLLTMFILGIICGSFLLPYLIAKFSSSFGQRLNISDQIINRITAFIFFLLAFYQSLTILLKQFFV